MSEHILQPGHAAAMVEYVRFLRRKRDQCIAEVAAEFKELREMRLFEESYTKDEVEGLLDGLLALVRTTMKKDLQTSMHSTVLLLKQVLEQAEKADVAVEMDLHSTEDKALLQQVEQWENSLTSGGAVPQLKARAAIKQPTQAPLNPVGHTQDPSLLVALEDQKESNQALTEKFQKLQIQCTGILKEKSELKSQVDALTAENQALSTTASASGDTTTVLNAQVKRLEAELEALRNAPPPEPVVSVSDVDSLKAELQVAQAQAADLTSKLDEAETEIQARIEKSKQFGNMRQILAKKNAVVKDLREQLAANGIAVKGDVDASED